MVRLATCLLVLLSIPVAAATVDEVRVAWAASRASYDVEAAERVLDEISAVRESDASSQAATLHVRAALLVAELLRIEFEDLPKEDRPARRQLGKRIDAAAREGLDVLDTMARGSDHFRLEADLLGTMIRTDFRANKYLDRMKAATTRALELDEGNAHAWVTAAKPLVFAGPKQGRDLDEAQRLLDHALELEPGLESALLLRAMTRELAGDQAGAEHDLKRALAENPECAPARKRLEGVAR